MDGCVTRPAAGGAYQGRRDRQPRDGRADLVAEPVGDSGRGAQPDDVEGRQADIDAGHQNEKRHQRRYAAACQHPVINLEHKKGAGEKEEIEDGGEADQPAETAAQHGHGSSGTARRFQSFRQK